jgi:tetratricopeptide (TPR) repeat protein
MKAANILVGILLLTGFFIAGQNVYRTFRVADIAALNNMQPQPTDYFLELGIHESSPDKNKIQCYVDYYEHMLKIFPNLWDAYGILGYCYHYLNNDAKAIQYLQIAVHHNPNLFWNYYNLAAIYINESRYQEGSDILFKGLKVPPVASFRRIFSSPYVYLPLLELNEDKSIRYTSGHLKRMYHSVLTLEQVIDQMGNNPGADAMMKKIQLELYAF